VKIVATLLLTMLSAIAPRPRLQSPIESTARAMLANFASGHFEAATSDFNDDLRPIVTAAVLAQVKGRLDQQLGRFFLVKEAHQGREDGFRTVEMTARFEKGDIAVVVAFDFLDRIEAVHFNPIVEVDPKLEAIAREVLANFTAGHFDEAVKPFDDAMRAQLPPSSMASLAANIAELFGTFRSITEIHQRTERALRIVDMTLAYTKAPVMFRVAFDAQNRVNALHISPYFKP
jgi:hypothetical protein